jgi:hypothetical protein
MIPDTKPDEWPDLQMDQQAWQKARSEFPDAPLSVVAARAQEIKDAAARGAPSGHGSTDLASDDKGQ